MYKDIKIKYSEEFARYTDAVLVTGDVNAYRIVLGTPWELDGCNFKVTAKRADGKVVTDLGTTEGTKAICVLASGVYSVVGDLTMQLTLESVDGTVLTACEITATVAEGNGEGEQAENLTPALDKAIERITVLEAEMRASASNLTNGDGMGSVMLKTAIAAISEGAVALGTGTTAGSKCFNITAFDDANKAYTLDSVEGLAVGDVFSLKLFNNYENIGKITEIRDNVVLVDNYHTDEESDVKYFRVPSKPTYGTIDFGIAAFAEGENCKAIGPNSHASGLNTIANGVCAHTEGRETTANYASHAEGGWTNANGQYAHTEGNSTEADANFAHAEGYQSKVTELGPMGHAEGNKTIVSAQSAHAEGRETIASGLYSHAEGYKTIVSAQAAHVEGDGATATGYASHAEGYKTKAANTYAHAEGKESNASGYTSHAEGCGTIASGINTHAEGDSATASGAGAHSEGYYSKAIGGYSHAEGKETVASGEAAHAEGWQATASGAYSHAEGYSSATKQYAHSEGYYSKAIGDYAHAENSNTTASGKASHSEGYKTSSNGEYSHAEGNNTVADGANSHSEGIDCNATADCSHAEGGGCKTTGKYSHAEGWGSKATAEGSHAENYSIANGRYSHSEGYGTSADSENQHVQGKYNIKDIANKYIHIAGNGTSNAARSNAYTLDWNGNAWYAGHVEASDIWLRSPGGKLFCLSVNDNGELLTTQINSDGSEVVEIN